MKILLFVILIIVLNSCSSKVNEYFYSETIYTQVHITEVNEYKYSKVQGYIIYKGIKLDVDNGNSGYYHKKYRLNTGDVIYKKVTIFQSSHYDNDPYKYSVLLSTSDIDFSEFEIK